MQNWEKVNRGAVNIEVADHLQAAVESGHKLRVKLGIDPSSPDIHLGHAVVLGKLRDFQELGHTAVLIIGDFTARIGDPSGQSTTRRPLEPDEIKANAKTYLAQVFKVVDPDKTEVRHQSEWFDELSLADVIRIAGKVTLAQITTRDDFRKRLDGNSVIGMHELLYPMLQGYDSVAVAADVELGGTDQLFNLLFARDIQRESGMPPQDVLTMPLLEGLDGVQKMSKSLGNYVGVADPPEEMFGKVMSVPDELIGRYFLLAVGSSEQEVDRTTSSAISSKWRSSSRLACRSLIQTLRPSTMPANSVLPSSRPTSRAMPMFSRPPTKSGPGSARSGPPLKSSPIPSIGVSRSTA